MNEPIFNPWLFYLLDMIGSLSIVFTIVLILSCMGLVITSLVFVIAYVEDENDTVKKIKPAAKKFLWVTIIILFLGVVIPGKDTVYKMIAASYITPTNINKAVEVGKDFKNEMKKDIFELIDKFNTSKKKEEKK